MVSSKLFGERCAGLSVSPVRSRVVVSEESGEGSLSHPAPHSRFGAGPTSLWLSAGIWVSLRREGWLINRKRVRRLYCLEGDSSACEYVGGNILALHRGPAPVPVGPHERWSMDVVHDTLGDGWPFRMLTVVDHGSRSSPVLEAGFRMSGELVGQVLDRVLGAG